MNNLAESARHLKDAAAFLQSAQAGLIQGDFKVAAHYAELTIELSAKAVIAYFEEPRWVHNPAPQLRTLVEKREFGEEAAANLRELIDAAEFAAPWHAWSTYGKRDRGTWVAAADLVTFEIADDLVRRAGRALEIARDFLRA